MRLSITYDIRDKLQTYELIMQDFLKGEKVDEII